MVSTKNTRDERSKKEMKQFKSQLLFWNIIRLKFYRYFGSNDRKTILYRKIVTEILLGTAMVKAHFLLKVIEKFIGHDDD